MSEQAPTKDQVSRQGVYYNAAHPEANPAVDLERIRRLEIESWLGPPPDNFLGRRDKWLAEQREYTLMQANALSTLIQVRRPQS